MRILALAALAAATAFPASAQAQAVGSWILSQTGDEGGPYFPGVVAARSGNTVTVQFDDGTREVRPANLLRPFNWRAGSKVECLYTDGNWYGATITSIASDGVSMNIRYDDGETQRTQTGRCRVS